MFMKILNFFRFLGEIFRFFFHRKKSGEDITCEKNCIFSRTFFSKKKIWKFPPKIRQFHKNSSKNIFWKSWKKIRTSRSKQNFTADRMEALSTSENHSKAQLLSKHVFFHDFCAKPVRRLGMGPLKKLKLRPHFWRRISNFRRIVHQDEILESPRVFFRERVYVSSSWENYTRKVLARLSTSFLK